MGPVIEGFASLPAIPVGSSSERLPYDDDALEAIGREFGRPATLAPFRVGVAPVYRIEIPVIGQAAVPGAAAASQGGASERLVITVTLWTSLGRVDATGPGTSVVATGIIAVDLVRGVEAIFRHPGGSVTITHNGRIMVRTGAQPHGLNGRPEGVHQE